MGLFCGQTYLIPNIKISGRSTFGVVSAIRWAGGKIIGGEFVEQL